VTHDKKDYDGLIDAPQTNTVAVADAQHARTSSRAGREHCRNRAGDAGQNTGKRVMSITKRYLTSFFCIDSTPDVKAIARPDFKRRLSVEPALCELHSELAEL
jgi:hypothetical protein